jgi:hypothetical protein
MRRVSFVSLLAAAMLIVSARGDAQGLSLIQKCPDRLQPVASASPIFPAHGPYRYRLVAVFIIDIGGTVVAPRVSTSEFVEVGTGRAAVPDGFESAFLAAFAKWKYSRQPKPCTATAELAFSRP